jgi:flagellar motor switch protein FliN/FliY
MSSTFTIDACADALVAELSKAVESILGGSVSAAGGNPARGDGWAVTFTATGALVGTMTAWMDRAGSALLAQRVTGSDEAAGDPVVADMLKEMWSQAAASLSTREPFTGVKLSPGAPSLAEAGEVQLAGYTVTFGADASAQVAVTAAAQIAAPAPAPPAAAVALRAQPAKMESLDAPGVQPSAAKNANLDVVLDIDLPLIVRFGRTLMTLKTLAALGPGSILDMGRSPDEPVEILVGEQVIARGEVVIVDGNYGVRITDLVSPSDRVKALEA